MSAARIPRASLLRIVTGQLREWIVLEAGDAPVLLVRARAILTRSAVIARPLRTTPVVVARSAIIAPRSATGTTLIEAAIVRAAIVRAAIVRAAIVRAAI